MNELRGRPDGEPFNPADVDVTTGPVSQPVHTGPSTGPAAGPATGPATGPWRGDRRPPAVPRRGLVGWIGRIARWLAIALLAWVGVVATLLLAYRFVDPPFTTVMISRWLGGESIDRQPLPITRISPQLIRAVVMAEDARFCRHHGVDWQAINAAIDDARDGIVRGASTITMQTAKNLFLWPSKSYIRKALEVPLALAIDFVWPKRRVLEVYLNLAEWGPGVFGAEAAAQYHFGKSAASLNAQEAALLAASLPNPIARDASDPGRTTSRLASRIHARMAGATPFLKCLGPLPRHR